MAPILANYKLKSVFNVLGQFLECFFRDAPTRMTNFCLKIRNILG